MELRALWDVSQQFQNKNGSINASGKIFVYFLGRTALATTYTSEDGNVVNSNPILLDNNGRATCYADTKYSYTVVVCDFYGKELFSYDITLHDAISTVEDVIVLGSDGTVLVDETQLPNGVQYDLSVNTDIFATNADLQATSAILQEEIDQNTIDISTISAALSDKKDKQSELIYGGNTTMTITKIKQNENGEITEVKYEPIDLPPEVPNVEIISPSGTVNVTSVTDTSTNTKTFELDVNQRDPFWHYWTGNNAWTKIYNGIWKEINRPAIGAGSQPHTWNPTITRGVWDAKAHFTVTFHNENENHVIPNDKLQIGFRAKLVGQNNPNAVNYIDLGAWVYDPSLYTTEWYQYNFAQESIRQNFDTSLIMNVANYFGDSAFDVYFEAKLLNTDGGPDASVTPIDQDICRVEITYFGIHEICNVNGTVTINNVTGSNYTEGWGININDNIISVDPTVIPEVSAFATESELAEVSANIISQIPESQVQSNWTETDDADPSFIQNKPEEIQLIAGTNVAITTSGNSAIISASGSGDVTEAELAEVSATLHTEIVNVSANIPEQVQSNWTETDDSDPSFIQNKPAEKNLVAGDNISMTVSGDNVIISSTASGDVMMSDLVNVSGNLHTEIQAVSAAIPTVTPQVQSDWTEDDDSDPSYIQNKPSEQSLVAGNGISLTSSGNTVTISAEVPTVTGFATEAQLQSVSGTLQNEIEAVSGAIPDEEEVEFEELDLSDYALVSDIPVVTGFVTNSELQSVSGTLHNEINNLPTPVVINYGDTLTGNLDLYNLTSYNSRPVCVKVPYNQLPDEIKNKVYQASNYVYLWYKSQFLEPYGSDYSPRWVFETVLSAPNFKYPTVNNNAYILRVHTTSNGSSWSIDSIKLADNQVVIAHVTVSGTYYPNATVTSDISATDFINAWAAGKAVYAIDTSHSNEVYTITLGNNISNTTLYLATTNTSRYFKLLTVTPSGWNKYHPDVRLATTDDLTNKQDKLTAGDNITISSLNVISSKDWSNDIASAVSGFATKAELQTVSAAIPDVSDMATQTWVGEQGYLTSVPSNYVTETELTGAVSGFATKTELNGKQNTLTGITDVQVVQTLPASPVATVLYLIPEV